MKERRHPGKVIELPYLTVLDIVREYKFVRFRNNFLFEDVKDGCIVSHGEYGELGELTIFDLGNSQTRVRFSKTEMGDVTITGLQEGRESENEKFYQGLLSVLDEAIEKWPVEAKPEKKVKEPWEYSRPAKKERDKIIWTMREEKHTWNAIANKLSEQSMFDVMSTIKANYARMKKIKIG